MYEEKEIDKMNHRSWMRSREARQPSRFVKKPQNWKEAACAKTR
jgi:hypothetical protein